MIVYEATKGEFCDSVFSGSITDEIYDIYRQKIGKSPKSQIMSWENSMQHMYKVLIDSEIPDDCGVAIEFTIPTTSKRIDFILTGENQFKDDSVVTVYYPDASESLFSIAKRFHTSVVEIAESNSISESVFSSFDAPLGGSGVKKLLIK